MSGVAVLDLFRPPHGFRTEAALVTTYSADLVSCLALLIAMDGTAGDSARYGRIEALRALERLRTRVRFVAQQGRLGWSGAGDTRILSLFDRVTRVIPPPGPKRAFHPKLMLARQISDDGAERFVLSVASRNLTPQSDWDMGIGLVAEGGSNAGTRQLAGLPEFVAEVCEAAGEPEHAAAVAGSGLSTARFKLPPGVEDIAFGFTTPRTTRAFKETLLATIPPGTAGLLVSPFLSAGMVRNAIEHLGSTGADLRLVSGRPALDKVAKTSARKLLRTGPPSNEASALPLEMATAEDDPETASANDDPEEKEERGLHAKVFGSATGSSAVLVLGSANLTTPAWLGGNWEAFVRISGERKTIFEPLWEWAETRPRPYPIPKLEDLPRRAEDPIDAFRDELSRCAVSLRDGAEFSTVSSDAVARTLERTPCKLDVARLTRSGEWATWRAAEGTVQLAPCTPRERTRFLVFRIRHRDATRTFLHPVDVSPPIDETRDREVFVDVLGVDDFLAYFQSLLTGEIPGSGSEPSEEERRKEPRQKAESEPERFHLEDLLRRLVDDPRAISELDSTFRAYADLMSRAAKSPQQAARLDDFKKCWEAVRAGMEVP